MTRQTLVPQMPPLLHLRVQLGLVALALLMVALPPLREIHLFLIPVAAGQVLVRHTLRVQDPRLHQLGWMHFLLCGLVIGTTGQTTGRPWAWGVALLGVLLLALLELRYQHGRYRGK